MDINSKLQGTFFERSELKMVASLASRLPSHRRFLPLPAYVVLVAPLLLSDPPWKQQRPKKLIS